MKNMEMDKTLTLVVVGYDVNGGVINFKKALDTKSTIKERGFGEGRVLQLQAPEAQALPFPVAYRTTNNHLLTIEYNFIEKKLVIMQDNYRQDNVNKDAVILDILKSLLTIAPSTDLSAFGINYKTDVLRENKLCLFNKDIESTLGQSFWDSNIGFKTELAFKNNDYTSTYRIYKDEKLSEEKKSRYYSFDANFNFELLVDDKATRVLDIFKENNKYFEIYTKNIENILGL